jgi:hypothetical protein
MKRLADMTIEECKELPLFEPFGYDEYAVEPDGTVTLKDGRVFRGLTVGSNVRVPRMQDAIRVMWYDASTPIYWTDEHGEIWTVVETNAGEYKRRRVG